MQRQAGLQGIPGLTFTSILWHTPGFIERWGKCAPARPPVCGPTCLCPGCRWFFAGMQIVLSVPCILHIPCSHPVPGLCTSTLLLHFHRWYCLSCSSIMAPKALATNKETVAEVRAAAPKFDRIKWSQSKNMRKLYFYCIVLCVCSATTGYDG